MKKKTIIKTLKIIIAFFPVALILFNLLALVIDCSISEGDGLFGQFQCDSLILINIFFAFMIGTFGLIVVVNIFLNKVLVSYRKALLVYIILIVFGLLIFLPNPLLNKFQKIVYIGGVTSESCSKGKSIYPWGVESRSYEKMCNKFHTQCEKVIDTDRPLEYYCYKDRYHNFNKYDDCDVLKNELSRGNCKLVVSKINRDTDYCLSEGYLKFVNDNIRGISVCLSGASGYSRFSSSHYGSTSKSILRCSKYTGLQADACLLHTAVIYNDVELCYSISSAIPSLKNICSEKLSK